MDQLDRQLAQRHGLLHLTRRLRDQTHLTRVTRLPQTILTPVIEQPRHRHAVIVRLRVGCPKRALRLGHQLNEGDRCCANHPVATSLRAHRRLRRSLQSRVVCSAIFRSSIGIAVIFSTAPATSCCWNHARMYCTLAIRWLGTRGDIVRRTRYAHQWRCPPCAVLVLRRIALPHSRACGSPLLRS